MHSCPENWVAVRCVVVYYVQAAHAFSAGVQCRHCNSILDIGLYPMGNVNNTTAISYDSKINGNYRTTRKSDLSCFLLG